MKNEYIILSNLNIISEGKIHFKMCQVELTQLDRGLSESGTC